MMDAQILCDNKLSTLDTLCISLRHDQFTRIDQDYKPYIQLYFVERYKICSTMNDALRTTKGGKGRLHIFFSIIGSKDFNRYTKLILVSLQICGRC